MGHVPLIVTLVPATKLGDAVPVPPFATANVPANVMVPDPVIGPPLVVRPVVPPLTLILVTVPPPPDVAIQLVTPAPSVDNTYPLVPGATGKVSVHALVEDALDLMVVANAPALALAMTKEPAVVLCTPSVRAAPLIVALALPDTAVPVEA